MAISYPRYIILKVIASLRELLHHITVYNTIETSRTISSFLIRLPALSVTNRNYILFSKVFKGREVAREKSRGREMVREQGLFPLIVSTLYAQVVVL